MHCDNHRKSASTKTVPYFQIVATDEEFSRLILRLDETGAPGHGFISLERRVNATEVIDTLPSPNEPGPHEGHSDAVH